MTVVIGGILSSTFLTLVLWPMLYEWVERKQETKTTKRKGKTMKTLTRIMAVAAWSWESARFTPENHSRPEGGGRLLENESPRAEFFVEKDKTVTITFYDKDLKAVSPG